MDSLNKAQRHLYILTFIFVTNFISISYAQKTSPLVVRYLPSINDDVYSSDQYYHNLLKLALDKTVGTYGSYKLEPAPPAKTVLDAIKLMMQNNGIDIVHTNTDKTRERVLLPIRIPLDKGLIGARLVMINEKDKSLFKDVKGLNDLKKFKFGQGDFWPDTEILKFNNLTVVTTKEYSDLFDQLNNGTFQGFPRAVFEIWDEVKDRPDQNLAIADGFYIYYPAAIYFFVRKDSYGALLAKRIEEGLLIAIKDGSFDKLFSIAMKSYLDKTNLNNRIGIKLRNPLLSDETPLDNPSLWYLKN